MSEYQSEKIIYDRLKDKITYDGSSGVSGESGHAWNLVRIDGNYYYCDLTYDDTEDGAGYKYFNISTDKLCENHTIDSKYITLPECNSSLE